MAHNDSLPNLTPVPTRDRRPGFMELVDWSIPAAEAERARDGARFVAGNEPYPLETFVLDAAKTPMPSFPQGDQAVVYNGVLRRKFSAGECSYGEARARTVRSFEDAAEFFVAANFFGAAPLVTLTPGADTMPSAVALLERMASSFVASRAALVLPPYASALMADVGLAGEQTPYGTRIVYAPGATPLAEFADQTAAPTSLTGYIFGHLVGARTPTIVTTDRPGDDFDVFLNDLYVTAEATWVIATNDLVRAAAPVAFGASCTIDLT